MKKVLTLLLLLLVACGGSSEEIVAEDTTTTTIPLVPTIDFDIIEIYNSKLRTELCSDAEEIDATSEECLRQYRDNLETVFSYAENLETYITELNTFFEAYPSAMTEEYKTLFQFIDDEYQGVPETYGTVTNKYIERFGGVPELLDFEIENFDSLNAGCNLVTNYKVSDNLKYGSLTYVNNTGEKVKIYLDNEELSTQVHLENSGGEFSLESGLFTNYLNEEFVINFESSFYVNFYHIRITNVYFDKETVSLGENFRVYFEWENPKETTLFGNGASTFISLNISGNNNSGGQSFRVEFQNGNNLIETGLVNIDSENNVGYVILKFKDINVNTNIDLLTYNLSINPLGNPFKIEGMYIGHRDENYQFDGEIFLDSPGRNSNRFNIFSIPNFCKETFATITLSGNNEIVFNEK